MQQQVEAVATSGMVKEMLTSLPHRGLIEYRGWVTLTLPLTLREASEGTLL